MPVVSVTGASPYSVTIGRGLTAEIARAATAAPGCRQVAVVHQPAVKKAAAELAQQLESQAVHPVLLEVPDAEAGKRITVCSRLWDELAAAGFSRQDVVVGLGGGAATDVAGFVAACWMRGVKVIQVPTTLLAMVDAAVGGKTGVNTDAGKNLVGAFHEPYAVFIDIDYLHSLPAAEIIAGSAEIIKTGFIADPVIIERYEADPVAALDPEGTLPELIHRSVAVKAQVVSQDLKESGLREILNYGHTFGHAVELAEDFTWRHGNAVAVGMVFIAELARIRGLIDAALVRRHRDILASVGLPVSYDGADFDTLHAGMGRDKKNRGGQIRFVALTGVGHSTRLEDATTAELKAAFAAVSGPTT